MRLGSEIREFDMINMINIMNAGKERRVNWTPAQNERRESVGAGSEKIFLSLAPHPRPPCFALRARFARQLSRVFFALKNREAVNSLVST